MRIRELLREGMAERLLKPLCDELNNLAVKLGHDVKFAVEPMITSGSGSSSMGFRNIIRGKIKLQPDNENFELMMIRQMVKQHLDAMFPNELLNVDATHACPNKTMINIILKDLPKEG